MALVTVGISPLFTATEGIAAQLSLSADADSYTLLADSDSFIHSGRESNNNFGDKVRMVLKSDIVEDSYARKGYLKFDLSSNTKTITDSELKLTVENIIGLSSGTLQIYGLNDGNPGENWEEDTITWNNAPGNNTGTTGFLSSEVTFLGDISLSGVTPGDTLSFNDSTLIDFLNSDTNDSVTFMFRSTPFLGDKNSLNLATKENSIFADYNVVSETTDVKATPEPTTILGLIGLGMWGISGKFRKKFN